jgi:hypothetical protein
MKIYKIALTEKDLNIINAYGYEVAESKQIEEYTVSLIKDSFIKEDQVVYQLSFQKTGRPVITPQDQFQEYPPEKIKSNWEIFFNELKSTINEWKKIYSPIYFASHKGENTSTYKKILIKLGFNLIKNEELSEFTGEEFYELS